MEPVITAAPQALVDEQRGEALTLRHLDARIKEVRKVIEEAKEVMYWRSSKTAGVEQEILDNGLAYAFPQNFSAIHQEAAQAADMEHSAKNLRHVVKSERTCLMLKERISLLETLRISKFINMYTICKRELDSLIRQIADNTTPEGKVAVVEAAQRTAIGFIAKDFTKQTIIYRDLAVEMVKSVQVAVTEVRGTVGEDEALIARLKDLDTAIRESLDTIFQAPELPCLVKNTDELKEISPAVENVLGSFTKPDSEYAYTLGWYAWSTRRYSDSDLLGKRIETEIGYKISGLLRAITEQIKSIFDGSEELESLTANVQLYKDCIDSLQRQLSLVMTEIHQRPLADLHALFVVSNGCNLALAEARLLHGLLVKLATKQTLNVCKAHLVLQDYLDPDLPKEPLGNALRLYQAAQIIEPFVPIVEPKGPIERISQTVQGVYERYVKVGLEPTAAEDRVWDAVMQGKLESLYGKKEDRALLPECVQTLLVKQITQILFREGGGKVASGELELLVSVVKRDERYGPTCNVATQFRDVVAEYDRFYQADRREDLLLEAKKILDDIFLLQLDEDRSLPRGVLLFSSLYQRCFEFCTDRILVDDKTKKTDDIRLSLYLLLFKKLDSLAEAREYPGIYPKFHLRRKLEDLVTDSGEGEGYTLMTELAVASMGKAQPEVIQAQVLEQYLLRALSCCLHSKDERERAKAQADIFNILELDFYEPIRGNFLDATKRLIEENTMDKFLASSFAVGPKELQRFIDGSLKRVLTEHNLPFSFNKVETTLYTLILLEQGMDEAKRNLTRTYRAHLGGERPFNKWFRVHRSFMVSTVTNRKALATLVPEQDHFGAPVVIDPRLYNELALRFGRQELEKIQREVQRQQLYEKL